MVTPKQNKVSGCTVKQKEVLVMGSSIIRGVNSGLKRDNRIYRVMLPGGGIDDVKTRVKKTVNKGKETMMVLMVGGNDISRGISTELFVDKYDHLIQEAIHSGVSKLTVCGMLPRKGINQRIMSLNCRIKKLVSNVGGTYIDGWDMFYGKSDFYKADGVHLTHQGDIQLGRLMCDDVNSFLG
jgi:lysophospholipase L1-like esterase